MFASLSQTFSYMVGKAYIFPEELAVLSLFLRVDTQVNNLHIAQPVHWDTKCLNLDLKKF